MNLFWKSKHQKLSLSIQQFQHSSFLLLYLKISAAMLLSIKTSFTHCHMPVVLVVIIICELGDHWWHLNHICHILGVTKKMIMKIVLMHGPRYLSMCQQTGDVFFNYVTNKFYPNHKLFHKEGKNRNLLVLMTFMYFIHLIWLICQTTYCVLSDTLVATTEMSGIKFSFNFPFLLNVTYHFKCQVIFINSACFVQNCFCKVKN